MAEYTCIPSEKISGSKKIEGLNGRTLRSCRTSCKEPSSPSQRKLDDNMQKPIAAGYSSFSKFVASIESEEQTGIRNAQSLCPAGTFDKNDVASNF